MNATARHAFKNDAYSHAARSYRRRLTPAERNRLSRQSARAFASL